MGKKINPGKLVIIVLIAACAGALVWAACASRAKESNSVEAYSDSPAGTEESGGSKVFFTGDISGEGLLSVFEALGIETYGNVAIKLHMGEPGNQNYLRPHLVRELTDKVSGTFVDSNVAYGGRRGNTAAHLQVARDHGFTFAPVDILDSGGEIKLPVTNGNRVQEALMGANIMNYDWIISVAHFKGHSLAGFGGTFKNLAIGIATPQGKRDIHSERGGAMWSSSGESFFEKIVEYNMALLEAMPDRIIYINVLNNLSVDCDCAANAPKSAMADIGIMASLDPVALEKASLDMIYAQPASERVHLVERIESQNGIYKIVYAEKMGLGSQAYELIRL